MYRDQRKKGSQRMGSLSSLKMQWSAAALSIGVLVPQALTIAFANDHDITGSVAPASSHWQQKIPAIAPAEPSFHPEQTLIQGDAALLRAEINTEKNPVLRNTLEEVYQKNGYQPLWHDGKHLSPKAEELKKILANAAEEGLEPSDYAQHEETRNTLQSDIRLSMAALRYAQDLSEGRFDPRRLSKHLTPSRPKIVDASWLTTLPKQEMKIALQSLAPKHEGYVKLRQLLKKEGTDDATRELIKANMERWRWLPTELGNNHILINIPAYELEMKQDGKRVHHAKVIVGKPNTPTPLFSDEMETIVLNPHWHVPVSIAKKEYLQKLADNPYYLAQQGFDIVGPRGRVVDPGSINWGNGLQGMTIRQSPGQRNALGHIKFLLPNDHAVYLHDTPTRHLFARETRAFSHGCVRVHEPFKLAEQILALSHKLNADQLRARIGGSEQAIALPQKLPVHMAYFTLEVDEQGNMIKRQDIYGYDKLVLATLMQKNRIAQVKRTDQQAQLSSSIPQKEAAQ